MIQKEKVLDEIIKRYKNPQHKGIPLCYNYKKEADNPLCGDDITIYITCENEIITKASFYGNGCSISQGCADLMCERFIGLYKNVLQDLEFDLFNLEESTISKSRYKCATLCLEAIKNI